MLISLLIFNSVGETKFAAPNFRLRLGGPLGIHLHGFAGDAPRAHAGLAVGAHLAGDGMKAKQANRHIIYIYID